MLEPYRVARFSQDNVLRRVYPPFDDDAVMYSTRQARQGICYGLSLNWLSRAINFKNEGPQQRIEYISIEQNVVMALQAQMYYNNQVHVRSAMKEFADVEYQTMGTEWYVYPINLGTDFIDRILINRLKSKNYQALAIKLFGLSTYYSVFKITLSSNNLEECSHGVGVRVISPTTHHIIGFYRGNGSHAMACSMSNGHLLFFDPNFGEARVPASDVQNFLSGVLSQYGNRNIVDTVEVIRIS